MQQYKAGIAWTLSHPTIVTEYVRGYAYEQVVIRWQSPSGKAFRTFMRFGPQVTRGNRRAELLAAKGEAIGYYYDMAIRWIG